MSAIASLLRGVYKLSGAKKAFALPEDKLLKAIERANRGRGFFMPSDGKAHYEKKMINGFPSLSSGRLKSPRDAQFCFSSEAVW